MTIRLELDGRAEGDPDPLIGMRIVGDHVIMGVLGEGGMGKVYWAEDPDVGRIAIKVLHPEYSARGEIVARFYGEPRAASKIGNRYIVRFISKGVLPDGRVFLAMEYLEGISLDKYLASWGALPLREALARLLMVGGALVDAHERDIIHRDLKPENMFVTDEELGEFHETKLLDFGIAKFGDTALVNGVQTRTGAVMGTPLYMSPEQAMGLEVGARSDLYSLALVAHVMLTGSLPQVVPGTNSWRDPCELRPDLPAGVGQALLHALEYHPNQRPATLRVWLKALVDAVDGGVALANLYAPGLLRAGPDDATRKHSDVSASSLASGRVLDASGPQKTTLGEANGEANASAQNATPTAMRRSRRNVALAIAALLAVAVVAVAAWSIGRRRADSDRSGIREEVAAAPSVAVDAAIGGTALALDESAAAAVIDAGVEVAPVDALPAPDAATPEPVKAPEIDAGPQKPSTRPRPTSREPKPKPKEMGSLRVVIKPWGEAVLDGKRRLGESPILVHDVPEGRHKVSVSNDDHNETITITIRAGKTTVVERNW